MLKLDSSNPALANQDAFNPFAYSDRDGSLAAAPANVSTIQGVVNKTALLVAIAVAAGIGGYSLGQQIPGMIWVVALGGFIVTLGIYFAITSKPARAKALAPVYAVVEGVFLGAVTGFLESMLTSMQITPAAGGLALQAFVITIGIMLAMLGLYKVGLLRPSRTFVAVLSTMTVGIGLIYLMSFVLYFFGVSLPFITVGSALQGGTPALIGLGLNVLILGVASLWLVVDFKLVEDNVAAGAPKEMEWYCGFALLVSLAWVYYEAVKLAFRLAILFGDRD